ncbi:aldo/keto reductase [Aeromonas veronii]|uniref:aldo/keto reductase n=1 Tax=Aeromonas veronii TaxID=654 RepID=UPI0013968609|nr:aldo/keto reductase [Aeromonas veronii]HDO1312618.1 aldo/keto reductase [Aeromonas veronii]
MNSCIVDKLCYGTMTFGHHGVFKKIGCCDRRENCKIVDYLYELGVRRYDTANGYSDGQAEKILGEALKRRHDVFISSKVCKSIINCKAIDLSYDNIIASCTRTLKNLQRDYIDVLYLHDIDSTVDIEESISALELLCQKKMIMGYGVCNYHIHLLHSLFNLTGDNFKAAQYRCSYIDEGIPSNIKAILTKHHVKLYGYSILGGGLLTGKYNVNIQSKGRFTRLGISPDSSKLKKAQALIKLSLQRGVPIEKLAFEYAAKNSDYTIFGANTLNQATHTMRSFLYEK